MEYLRVCAFLHTHTCHESSSIERCPFVVRFVIVDPWLLFVYQSVTKARDERESLERESY